MDHDHARLEGHVNEASRIVLFGVHGMLGGRLNDALTAAGYEVTGIDRARCDFETATAKDIAIILRAVEPQLVINAAAYTAVDMAESEPARAMRINAEMAGIIAHAAAEQATPSLYFSSDYVFDGQRGAPYDENAASNPLNIYGQSKRAGELAVLGHGGHVMRLQWVYAAAGTNFFTRMRDLLAAREEVRVVADQLGAPSHAWHVAQAVVRAVPRIIRGQIPHGVYHLTAMGHTSWHGFACAIARASNSKANVVPLTSAEYPVPAARPADARLDSSALASLGIAMPHWREGVALAIKESHAAS